MTQQEFAHLLGVSPRTLQDWEQGRREPTGAARTLLKVAVKYPRGLARPTDVTRAGWVCPGFGERLRPAGVPRPDPVLTKRQAPTWPTWLADEMAGTYLGLGLDADWMPARVRGAVTVATVSDTARSWTVQDHRDEFPGTFRITVTPGGC